MNRRAIIVFAIIGSLLSVAVIGVLPVAKGQASGCHDEFIFHWFTLDDVLDCLDSASSGGVTSITPSGGLGTNVTTGDILIFPKWELLCENVLVSSATSLTCANFEEKNYLIVHSEQRIVTSSVRVGMVFNLDTGNNYAYRLSANGGADTTATNTNNCQLGLPSAGQTHSIYAYIDNNEPTDNKVMFIQSGSSGAFGAGNTPGRIEMSCKWANTTDAITTISLVRVTGTGSYDTDTRITIWGYD